MSDDTTRAANPPSRRPIDFRRIGLVWTILLLPIEIGAAVYDPQLFTSGYASVVMFTIFDIPLLLLAAGALLPTIQRIRSRDVSLGTGLTLVLLVAGLVSFVFHPSPSGVGLLIRLALLVIVAFEVSGLDRERLRRRVGGPLLIGSSIQGVIGLAQVINGGALGLGGLGERSVFFTFGDSVAAMGTMLHPYVLSGFAILAVTVGIATLPAEGTARRWWLIGIGVSSISLGLTYSRSGALATVLVVGVLAYGAIRNADRYRSAVLAMVAGAVIPALIFSAGWLDRLDQTATTDLNDGSSRRIELIEQAVDLIETSPIVGVGAGRFAIVLEESPGIIPQVVHNVPLYITAENGVPAGLVALAFFVLIAIRAFRTSPAAAAVALGLGVWMLFDKFTYMSPNGMVMFAIWLGVLDQLARAPKDVPVSASDRAPAAG